jgi:release factor glutamine methyltransferase
MTLQESLQRATHQLDSVPNLRTDAARDAALLLRHALSISHTEQLAHPKRPLTPAEVSAYETLIARRLTLEPIQYITGEQEFYGLALGVTPAVLIPRPETEHLVESVLAELANSRINNLNFHSERSEESPHFLRSGKNSSSEEKIRILDIGTGSGAIAIALAHHLPQAHVTAVDLSPAALAVAAANAARHGLSDRIRFVQSDLLVALAPDSLPFDAIVSNPPYVPETDRASLHPQVRDHEPASALFAGPDGLDIYRRLIPQARAALAPCGLLALEIGQGQRNSIAALLAGWVQVRFVDDLQRIPRVALARNP